MAVDLGFDPRVAMPNQQGDPIMKNLVQSQIRCVVVFLLTCMVSGGAWTGQAFAEKNGFVDMSKIFDEYDRTRQNDERLSEEGKRKQEERDSKVQEIRRLKDELALLSDQNKEEKQQVIDEKIRTLQEFDENVQEELGRKRDETVKLIIKDIDGVVADYGKRNAYDFIFNERAVVFRNNKLDVTSDVLNELNTRYKDKSADR